VEALEDRWLLSGYTVTDLGQLGGLTASAVAINNAGEVVGTSTTNAYYTITDYTDAGKAVKRKIYQDEPFLWAPSVPNGTKGSMIDIGNDLGWTNAANGINASGQVVGTAEIGPNPNAFLWTPAAPNGTSGGAVDLGTLGSGECKALGINRSGQVVGLAGVTSENHAAFLWTPAAPNGTSGTMIDLGTLGGTNSGTAGTGSVAFGINGSGQVVGQSVTTSGAETAFLWTPATPNGTIGTMAALPTLAGAAAVSAAGINDSGEVVGTVGMAAFLYSGGKMIDLGSLPGGGGSIGADAINSSGQVVGSSGMSSGLSHAFLWTPTTPNGTSGTMVDLNTLISATKVTLEVASGINDQGQIVGTDYFNNEFHAFLLTPTTTTKALAQRASSTPPGTVAGLTGVPGSDTSLAAVLALPTSDSTIFGPTTVSVAMPVPQPLAAVTGATSPAMPFSLALPFEPPLTGHLPPTGHVNSFPPAWASETAADLVIANLDAETSLATFVDDLALTGWDSEGLTPVPLRG
jgi:probable HAF family extracellular repeat protein